MEILEEEISSHEKKIGDIFIILSFLSLDVEGKLEYFDVKLS